MGYRSKNLKHVTSPVSWSQLKVNMRWTTLRSIVLVVLSFILMYDACTCLMFIWIFSATSHHHWNQMSPSKSMLNDLWLNESAFILVWLMASDFCCLTHHRTNHVELLESKLVMAESSRHETTKKITKSLIRINHANWRSKFSCEMNFEFVSTTIIWIHILLDKWQKPNFAQNCHRLTH